MLNVCIQISALFDVEYHLEDLSPTGRTVSLTYNPENDGHAKIATVENHQAVIMIRKHYPEYEPEPDLIRNPPSSSPTWWERMPAKPSPENCPGSKSLQRPHPVNITWCQVCGWKAES